jgi:hypothetical protein
MNLSSIGDEAEDQFARLGAVARPKDRDAVRLERGRRAANT